LSQHEHSRRPGAGVVSLLLGAQAVEIWNRREPLATSPLCDLRSGRRGEQFRHPGHAGATPYRRYGGDLDAICGSPTASSTARCSLTVRSPCCTVSPGERYSRRSPAPPSRTLPSAKGLSRGRRLPDDLRGGSNSSRSGALRPALTTGLSQSEPLRPLDYLRSGAATGAPAGRRRAPASSNARDPGQRAAQTRFATKPPGDRGRTICCIRAAASARMLATLPGSKHEPAQAESARLVQRSPGSERRQKPSGAVGRCRSRIAKRNQNRAGGSSGGQAAWAGRRWASRSRCGSNAPGGSARPSVAYSPKRLIGSVMYGERAARAPGVIA